MSAAAHIAMVLMVCCLTVSGRFYGALILNDLIQEVPPQQVSDKYKVPRGLMQQLQDNSGGVRQRGRGKWGGRSSVPGGVVDWAPRASCCLCSRAGCLFQVLCWCSLGQH